MYQNIVIGYDGSDRSEDGFARLWARGPCAARGCVGQA